MGRKVIIVRPRSDDEAERDIVEYLEGRPSAYVSDLPEALGMDFEEAFRVTDRLLEKGQIARTEEPLSRTPARGRRKTYK